jgi:hypothetical protein
MGWRCYLMVIDGDGSRDARGPTHAVTMARTES